MDRMRIWVKSIIRSAGIAGDRALNVIEQYNHNWKLKHKYSLRTDEITPEYKKEVKVYWKKYTDKFKTDWNRYYSSRNGIYDVRYIPDDLYFTKIDPHFNNKKMTSGLVDKNYHDILFSHAKQAVTIVKKINGFYYDANFKIIDKNEVVRLCLEYPRLIIKPAVLSGNSKGIEFWSTEQGSEGLIKLIFAGDTNLVVQEIIRQHQDLSRIHPSSINTIRIITLLLKGKVHILSSVLRMGIDGSNVDNLGAGGISCGIKENGQLKDKAFSTYGVKYDRHPQGFEFGNCVVPSFDKVKEIVIKEQTKLAHFRLVSWDLAVDEDGNPILVEANLRNGGLNLHQFSNGPLFGELTDDVLQEVFLD
jgi:hypothetical protein